MANFYITINDAGDKQEVEASDISAGVADAGDIVALNSEGEIDSTMLPSKLGSLITNVSGSFTLDFSLYNKWELVLQADTKIYFDTSNMPTDNTNADVTMVLKQDDIGGRFPTFQYGSVWPNSTVPTFSTDPEAKDVVTGFHLHATPLWYLRVEGLNYAGVLGAGIDLLGTASIGSAGSYILSFASDMTNTATIVVSAGIVHPASADMVAGAVTDVTGRIIFGAGDDQTGSAWITATAVVSYGGATDMTVTAAVTPLGGIITSGAVDMASAATITAVGQSKIFVEGVVSMTADATVSPAGAYIVTGPTALAADATIAAAGATADPLVVIFTDSTDVGTYTTSAQKTFAASGASSTTTGGTPPYTYTLTMTEQRSYSSSTIPGYTVCDNTNDTTIGATCLFTGFDSGLTLNGTTVDIWTSKDIHVTDDGTSSTSISLTNSAFVVIGGGQNYDVKFTLRVVDSLLEEDTTSGIVHQSEVSY